MRTGALLSALGQKLMHPGLYTVVLWCCGGFSGGVFELVGCGVVEV